MKIKSTKFVKGILGSDEILDQEKKQIAFFGRSNVGKSSVINSICNQKVARSSSKPGKTLEINIFEINDDFYFLDFPGFGYAKVNAKKQEKIRKMILWYLTEYENENRFFVLIIDSRVGITDMDKEIIKIFKEFNYKFVIIANKSEKLIQKKRSELEKEFQALSLDNEYILYSAIKKQGVGELLDTLDKQL